MKALCGSLDYPCVGGPPTRFELGSLAGAASALSAGFACAHSHALAPWLPWPSPATTTRTPTLH